MSPKPRLLVLASTFPASATDPTPAFVRDLAVHESVAYDTTVLVPSVPGGAAAEQNGSFDVRRFRYFPRRWEDLADGAIVENIRVRRTRIVQVPPFFAAEVLAVKRAVRELRPDVVHAHWLLPQGLAALLAAPGIPMVATSHGADLYAMRDPLSTRLIRAVVGRASLLTTQNADLRERLIELGCPPEKVVVAPVGADTALFRAVAAGQTRSPRRILFVGRLVEKKGLAVLLEALRGLDPARFELVVVGDGPLRPELERQADGLPVNFLGGLSRVEVAAECGRAAIAVFPSVRAASGDQDGLPLALVEAMAAGCAVVGSDLSGLNDAIEDGCSGRLVPAGDSKSLAQSISELLDDPVLTSALSKGGAERSDDYSAERMGARFVALLDQVRQEAPATR